MKTSAKIALIGNMNNNNFSIMRYFRDLGYDAHLFLLTTDGSGSNSHFIPENDTWEISKWNPYIHKLNFADGYTSLIFNPKTFTLPVSAKKISEAFEGFNIFIGSGMVPVLLEKADLTITVYYPYSTGIEFYNNGYANNFSKSSYIKFLIYKHYKKKLAAAIRNAHLCFNAELSLTKESFREINKEFIEINTPLFYNNENIESKEISEQILNVIERIKKIDVKIISQSRQLWPEKRNDKLIIGFASFKKRANANAALILFEYGKDVNKSKQLISELGISDNVIWVKKSSRKEIFLILKHCDIGANAFLNEEGAIWGGTAWELLAAGLPTLQSFNFTSDSYQTLFKQPPPPFIDAKSEIDIENCLYDFVANQDKYKKIGENSKQWFDQYNGIGLAQKWLQIIEAHQNQQ
jgi:hypothetical protein